MPTYVYQCEDCRARFELKHSINACDTAQPCPVCAGYDTHRVPQAAYINWGGLAPSRGGLSPAWRNLVDESNRQRRIDKYRKQKAIQTEQERLSG